jgi:hypothetical protein
MSVAPRLLGSNWAGAGVPHLRTRRRQRYLSGALMI